MTGNRTIWWQNLRQFNKPITLYHAKKYATSGNSSGPKRRLFTSTPNNTNVCLKHCTLLKSDDRKLHYMIAKFTEKFNKPIDHSKNWHIHVKEGKVRCEWGRTKLSWSMPGPSTCQQRSSCANWVFRPGQAYGFAPFLFQFTLFDVNAPIKGMVYNTVSCKEVCYTR